VQGDYALALGSCLVLAKFSASLTAATCINSALRLSAQARSSYERLFSAVADMNFEAVIDVKPDCIRKQNDYHSIKEIIRIIFLAARILEKSAISGFLANSHLKSDRILAHI
jgi:hypothetical protein